MKNPHLIRDFHGLLVALQFGIGDLSELVEGQFLALKDLQHFRIEPRGQIGEPHQVAEQHGELAAFCVLLIRRTVPRHLVRRRGFSGLRSRAQFPGRCEQFDSRSLRQPQVF